MSRRNAPNNMAMEAPSFRVGSHQFTTQVRVERRSYKKVEWYVSSEQIPQVPGGEHHKIYPHDDSKKFGGTERKAVVTYALGLQAKYGNCAIVGSGADLIKPKKAGIELGE